MTKSWKIAGFTLTELLVVIAVIGVLSSSILIVINPVEQLARARDAGRISSIAQLGKALASKYASEGSINYLVPTATTWITDLESSNDIKVAPGNPTSNGYTYASCSGGSPDPNGYCYKYDNTTNPAQAIVYAPAESKSEIKKAGAACTVAYITWSSINGKVGLLCAEPRLPGIGGYSPFPNP